MNKFEKIISLVAVVLVLGILLLGSLVFYQQKKLNTFENKVTVGAGLSGANMNANTNNSLTEGFRQFLGKVTAVNGPRITLSAQLVDFSKPKNADKTDSSKGPVNFSSNDFETTEKTIVVNVKDSTQFLNGNLSQIKPGDMVGIMSDVSPYNNDEVTALNLRLIK